MSLAESSSQHEVHFPANPDRFEFDGEVSKIFDKMARRSIPNYELAHRMHAAIAASKLKDGGSVLDIGASHGEFLHALYADYSKRGVAMPRLTLTATDVSTNMCDIMRSTLPGVRVMEQDLMENEFLRWNEKFDFINCMYVLQFLPSFAQPLVLTKLCTMLKPGGVLSIGQKESKPGHIGEVLQQQYVNFRLENGYTQEEIDAKTHALKNAMWPMTNAQFKGILYDANMHTITPITRSGVFCTYIAER